MPPTTEARAPRARALQQEKPLQGEAHAWRRRFNAARNKNKPKKHCHGKQSPCYLLREKMDYSQPSVFMGSASKDRRYSEEKKFHKVPKVKT